MQEVKNPKKPWIYYYGIVLLIIFVLNVIAVPQFAKMTAQRSVQLLKNALPDLQQLLEKEKKV